MATRIFKITYVDGIIFLLDDAALSGFQAPSPLIWQNLSPPLLNY